MVGSEDLIVWFEDLGREDNDIVGKKCANLGEMMRFTHNVPAGFAMTRSMYRSFLEETGAGQEMTDCASQFGDLEGAGLEVFTEMSHEIQGIILGKEMPYDLRRNITNHYAELCSKVGISDVPVSVRSSGIESRPGMFDTFLNVKGAEQVVQNTKTVWASAYTTRAIAFKVNKKMSVLGDELGVGVVKMVNAKSAGIGFTVDPVTGDGSKVVIESNWGLGEGVVSGAERVDRFVVDKHSLAVEEWNVSRKTRCVVNTETGVEWQDVAPEMQDVSSLTKTELIEVAKLAKLLEERMGCPQDIEWAIDSDFAHPQNVFLLQTRPAKVVSVAPVSTADRIVDMMSKKLFRLSAKSG